MKTLRILPLMLAVAAVLALDACADSTAPLPTRIAASARRETPISATRTAPPTKLYGGRAADSALRAIAATWAKRGDRTLLDQIATRQRNATPIKVSGPHGSKEPSDIDDAGQRVSAVNSTPSSTVTPSTRPTAVIYSSSTTAYLNGTSGLVSSYLIYYGNMARTTIASTSSYSDNLYPPYTTTTPHQELGYQYPCAGDAWTCAWTFNLSTLVTVGFTRDCGTTLEGRGDHSAWWQVPVVTGYFAGATWGFTYAQNSPSRASTSPCAPPTVANCRATTTNTTLFSPTLDPGGIAVPCNAPASGTVGGGVTCSRQYIYIESQANGVWTVIWQGWVNVCS